MRWIAMTIGALTMSQAEPDAVDRILKTAQEESQAYEKLCHLCDRIGHRLSGSAALDRAIDWAVDAMKKDGLANVRKEKVMVPVWVRGAESATIVEPARHELSMLGLGGSVGTPPEGITAEVAVLKSFDELGEGVRGKIVLYNVPFTTYGETVPYRVNGAARAAKFGAVASLVRSVGPVSLRTPHTGMMRYDESLPKIPTAAVTIEDAELIRRLVERGQTVRLKLVMGAKTLPDAESANVVGEVPGRTDEIVLIGGHIDSWDVGQGAHDDGAGCVIMMEAARVLLKLGLRPRRTVRVVLFTNEENGLRGGIGYRDAHKEELPKHLVAMESDAGGDSPLGFGISMADKEKQEKAIAKLREFAARLKVLGADRIRAGGGGADIGPLAKEGVPVMSHDPETGRYWEIHHTPADTVDKVDPEKLARNVAAVAAMVYMLAEMEGRLGE
jgi:carboxypeptidase Q